MKTEIIQLTGDSFYYLRDGEEPIDPDNLEEAEEFIKEDLKNFGYDGVYGITPLTEQELYSFFDTENIDKWKVLTK